MATALVRKIVLVTRKTRMEELVARHHTLGQAKFYIEHLGADFSEYQHEHETYVVALRSIVSLLESHGRYQVIDRAFLTNFLFALGDIVLALGQDGLVANTMKYLDGQPLVGVNPEPTRYDGVLLPFVWNEVAALLPDILLDRRPVKEVTMAKATLSDRQVLYAVNDLFIGPKSHTSARYEISHENQSESQSSSGVIVSTGLGSTAWFKSVVTGSEMIVSALRHRKPAQTYKPSPWDSKTLRFAVREPFPSKTSQANLIYGTVNEKTDLRLRSLMPEGGVIFSDGIESDCLTFNSGTEAIITVAERRGRLVT